MFIPTLVIGNKRGPKTPSLQIAPQPVHDITPEALHQAVYNVVEQSLVAIDAVEGRTVVDRFGSTRQADTTALLYTAAKVQEDLRVLRLMNAVGELFREDAPAPDPTEPPTKRRRASHEYMNRQQVIAELARIGLTREEQAAVGLELVRLAADRASNESETENGTRAETDRVMAAQQLLATMDDEPREHAIRFVTAVATHAHDPKPFRDAIAGYVRHVLGLEDISYVLDTCGRFLVRWAGTQGAERPDIQKSGRPKGTRWDFDHSELRWLEWIPAMGRLTPGEAWKVNTNHKEIAKLRAYISKRAAADGMDLPAYVATVVLPWLETKATRYNAGQLAQACRELFVEELQAFEATKATNEGGRR